MGLYKNKPRNYEARYKNIKPKEKRITFGTLTPEGLTNVREISSETTLKCPHCIMVPEHYKPDGTCLCFDQVHQAILKNQRAKRTEKLLANQKRRIKP